MSSPRPPSELDPRVLYWIPGLVAIGLMVRVLQTWAARFRFPHDLEWMEGGMLAHAWRLQQGLPLYPDAGPDWMPYVYPPGYSALLALLGWGNLDYPVGRAISIVGVLAASAALVWAVGRRGGWGLGVVCAGIFLGCYGASGAFYDLVRPDGLAIGLLGWSIAIGIERTRRAPEIAGILLFLAFTVKHHSAAFGFAFLAALWVRGGWREALRFTVASAVPALAFTLVLQWQTDGLFLRWLLGVPASHPMVGSRVFPGGPLELARLLLVSVGLAAVSLARASGRAGAALGGVVGAILGAVSFALEVPRGIDAASAGAGAACAALLGLGLGAWIVAIARRSPDWRLVFAGALALVGCVVAGLMRGHNGGFLNVYMPVHWLAAAGFGFAATELARWRPTWPMSVALAAIAVAQIGWQQQTVELRRLVPNAADVAAGETVVAALREHCHGEILSPYAAWLPVRVGRAPSWHLIALWDIQHPEGPFRAGLGRVSQAVRAHRWACIVEGGSPRLGMGTSENYRPGPRFSLPGKALQPKTGWRVRPSGILLPKEAP